MIDPVVMFKFLNSIFKIQVDYKKIWTISSAFRWFTESEFFEIESI